MRTALLFTLLVLAGCGSHRQLQTASADTTGCRSNQRAVPAGAHCQECGPLDGCLSSPATCRPACTRQSDCADGTGCDTRLGACVRLCG